MIKQGNNYNLDYGNFVKYWIPVIFLYSGYDNIFYQMMAQPDTNMHLMEKSMQGF